jgi:hypothetical protein
MFHIDEISQQAMMFEESRLSPAFLNHTTSKTVGFQPFLWFQDSEKVLKSPLYWEFCGGCSGATNIVLFRYFRVEVGSPEKDIGPLSGSGSIF